MFMKHNPEVGARPGTLAIPPGSPAPRITVVQYDANSVEKREVSDPPELRALHDSDLVTWVDVQGLGDETILRAIGDAFDLHPVALENAVNVPQRAKTELYERMQLVIARTPLFDDGIVQVPQVCFVIGSRILPTFQERYLGIFDPVRERIAVGIGAIRTEGPDYLAYALIDAMIDRYYPVAQRLADELEDLEDIVIENPHPEVLSRVHAVRRQLVDSSREMASDLAEAYLSNVSHRTNEIMKVLTLMASIFIPLTFLAGIYGMNFQNMPELASRNGYFVVLSVMAVLGFGMVGYFRRRGWIGSTPPPPFRSERSERSEDRD